MEHYFSKNPKSELILKKIKFNNIEIFTGSGLFSIREVDKGSKLLIKKCRISGKVLDLGCGYGVIGITLKLKNPELNVIFSDINRRAVDITKKNLNKYKLKCNVIQSDGFENIKEKFDTILLNPPQTAGKELCFKLIRESFEHLEKDGSLQIVARHNKGGKVLSEKMKEIFGNLKELGKGSGYRVYISFKKL